MDFGLGGFDNLVSSTSATNNAIAAFSLDNNKQKCYGSGFLKQDRTINDDDFRDFKVAKTASYNEPMLKIPFQRSITSNVAEGHQQMLCFSSPNSLPYYSSPFSRNTGYSSTGINSASMQGVLSGVRGPFTPSQLIELEHQALIYKYITANVPVPSYLLNPIRKAFESAGFSSFPGLRSNALGWGAFHLGFSNTDPEPGRCRRTDGKKWRCSRDAVADQKYCERHMNRGRHRSRKPVEGQSGHSASGTTTTNAKLPPASSSSASVVPAGGVSNSPGLSHHLSNMQHGSSNHLSGTPNINRSLLDKENTDGAYQLTALHSITSPKVCPKTNFSIPKQQNPYEESSRPEFGLVCSDSLLNPLNRSSSLVNCRNYSTTSDNLNNHEHKSQNHPFRQFMDDWPKKNSERSTISWPNVDLQPDRTQLSISIPMITSDFMPSASSPTNEKLRASPLRLSGELEMGLGVGTVARQENQRQINCVPPISWEPSIGGPLGEALHATGDSKSNTKPLNLIDSWDNSPRLASSPTGVLQRGAFGSLSNSSAGSSPRADGVIGSSVLNHSSFPAL